MHNDVYTDPEIRASLPNEADWLLAEPQEQISREDWLNHMAQLARQIHAEQLHRWTTLEILCHPIEFAKWTIAPESVNDIMDDLTRSERLPFADPDNF